jgi:hypothetical protein
MLGRMQESAQSRPSAASANFAGILAALASPPPEDAAVAAELSESDLGEDVVTLSYDRALRAHARYMPPDRGDRKPEGAPVLENLAPLENRMPRDPLDRDLRTTSVTVRLSKAECASLHERAAEAGLTVSAYLRSCALEAEVLRAQVKEALAGMRSAAMTAKTAPATNERRPIFGWLTFGWMARLIPHRRSESEAC